MLNVYWADISNLSLSVDALLLSEYRANRLEKIKSEQKKRQSLGAELLLIHALRELYPEIKLPLEIKCSEKGKPYLESIPVHFSLSHSGDYAACAVSDAPVGMDIEHDVKARETISNRFFSPEEQNILLSAENKDLAFARIWTAKESALKLLGTGLAGGLSSITVYDNNTIKSDSKMLQLHQFTYGTLCFSLCTENKHKQVQINKIELKTTTLL